MSSNNTFKFTFTDPNKEEHDLKEDTKVSDLTAQFSRISAVGDSRLDSFKSHRLPLASRSRSEALERRRLEALELQKKQRHISISKARQLALGTATPEDDEEEEEEEEEGEGEEDAVESSDEQVAQTTKRARDDEDDEMEDVSKIYKTNPRTPKKKNKKKRNIHANQIMYAETMEEVPSDFIENWVTMICPKGKRCLVTSGRGETIARSRAGHIIGRFQSMLPNGSRKNRTSDFCILDCVYDAVHWTFYVLDIMCWRGYPIFDCDTNFRHFWLQTKLDLNELDKPDGENQFYKFTALKPVLTSETALLASHPEQYLQQHQGFDYPIDGLLFYHRQAHYQGGSTPLVCWVPRESVNELL